MSHENDRSLLSRRRLTSCPAGEYYSSKFKKCSYCPGGQYYPSTNTGKTCKTCPAGQFSCYPCAESKKGQLTTCYDCDAGQTATAGQSACTILCQAGYYSPGGGVYPCQSCPGGQYSVTVLNAGNSACMTCGEGQYSPSGSSTCTDCAGGQYAPSAEASECKLCPAGEFAVSTAATSCSLCPKGSYEDNAGSSYSYCKACPAGYYSDVIGQSECRSCPPGSYSDEPRTSNSLCTSCSPGYFRNSTQNGTTCTACAVGRYAASARSSSCTDCQAGLYNNDTQQTACLACPPSMSCYSATTVPPIPQNQQPQQWTVGTSVGVSFGVVAVVAVAVGIFYLHFRRRQSERKRKPSQLGIPLLRSASADSEAGAPSDAEDVYESIAWLSAAVKSRRRDWSVLENMCNVVMHLDRTEHSTKKSVPDFEKVLTQAMGTLHAARAENQLLLDHAVSTKDYDFVASYGLREKKLASALPSGFQSPLPGLECITGNLLLYKDRFSGNSAAFLGRGASGAVTKGIFLQTIGIKQLRTEVAVKEIVKVSEASEEEATREIMILKLKLKKHHPNIIRIYDVAHTSNAFYVIMQLCQFSMRSMPEDFRKFLHGVETVGRIVLDALVQDIVTATVILHRYNIFHCDIKPSNILVAFNRDGKEHTPQTDNFHLAQFVLADFGVSRVFQTSHTAAEGESLTITLNFSNQREQSIAGTEAFMAPEMISLLRRVKKGTCDAPELNRDQLVMNDSFGCGCAIAFLCSDLLHPFSSAMFPRIAENILADRRQSFSQFAKPSHIKVCENLTCHDMHTRWTPHQALECLRAGGLTHNDDSTTILLDQIQFHQRPKGSARQQLVGLASSLPFLKKVLTTENNGVAPLDAAAQKLKSREQGLPTKLDDDAYFALAAYTFDTGGERHENVYFQLNLALRTRKSHPDRFNMWQGFGYFLMRGLDQLEKVRTDVFRGCVLTHDTVKKDYVMGRTIQWAAFTSTSTNPAAAKMFIKKSTGVVFKIAAMTATNVGAYSFIPKEEELLLSPNSRFVVTKELYVDADGFACVDLVESQAGILKS